MHTAIESAGRVIRIVGKVSPRLATRLAFAAFFSTRPRLRAHPRDATTMAEATREHVVVRGRRTTVYRWGETGPVVVLVHGWRGRASQFSALVRALREEGYRVLAFDAAAHGTSRGSRADVRDWIASLVELQRRHGRFRAVIGHSLGGFASLTAARQGLATDAVVAISATGTPDAFLREFARMMSLDGPTLEGVERLFVRRLGEDRASLAERYDSLAHPLGREVPLLLVHGTADRQLPADESRRLHAAHPASSLLLVDGVGHSRVLAEREVLDAVVGFVGQAAAVEGGLPAGGRKTAAPSS